MGWTRSSATYRELVCPGSLILPRKENPPNEGTEWGHLVHAWSATGIIGRTELGLFPNHARLFQRKLETVPVDRLALWPAGGNHEVAVAINCLKKEVEYAFGLSPRGIEEWKAQWPDWYITGAIDYLGEILDDLWVDDLKTGKTDDPRILTPRRRSQVWTYDLAAYLLGARLRPGITTNNVHSSITWWPRYPVSSEPVRVFQSIANSELDRWWLHLNKRYTGLVTLRKKPETIRDHLKMGSYCYFCPSKMYCVLEQERQDKFEREYQGVPYDADAD